MALNRDILCAMSPTNETTQPFLSNAAFLFLENGSFAAHFSSEDNAMSALNLIKNHLGAQFPELNKQDIKKSKTDSSYFFCINQVQYSSLKTPGPESTLVYNQAIEDHLTLLTMVADDKPSLDAIKHYGNTGFQLPPHQCLNSALTIAIKKNHEDIVHYFLTEKNDRFSSSQLGDALTTLVSQKNYGLAHTILKSTSLNKKTDKPFLLAKNTALLTLLDEENPNIAMMEDLLNDTFVFYKNSNGESALQIAFDKDMQPLIELIFQKYSDQFQSYTLVFILFDMIDQQKTHLVNLLLEKRPGIKTDFFVIQRIQRELQKPQPDIDLIKTLSSDTNNFLQQTHESETLLDLALRKKQEDVIQHVLTSQKRFLTNVQLDDAIQRLIMHQYDQVAEEFFRYAVEANLLINASSAYANLLRLATSTQSFKPALFDLVPIKQDTPLDQDLRSTLSDLVRNDLIQPMNLILSLEKCPVSLSFKREFGYPLARQWLDEAESAYDVYRLLDKLKHVSYLYKRQGHGISFHGHQWQGQPVSNTWTKLIAAAKNRIHALHQQRHQVLSEEDIHFLQSQTNRWSFFSSQESMSIQPGQEEKQTASFTIS